MRTTYSAIEVHIGSNPHSIKYGDAIAHLSDGTTMKVTQLVSEMLLQNALAELPDEVASRLEQLISDVESDHYRERDILSVM